MTGINPEDFHPDIDTYPTELMDFRLMPEKLSVEQMTTLIFRNKGERVTDWQTGNYSVFAAWEDEETYRTFRLVECGVPDNRWYTLHVRNTLSETEPHFYNYWATGISYEESPGVFDVVKSESELHSELYEMLQTSFHDQAELSNERKRELADIASHVAVQDTLKMPGATELLHRVEFGDPIQEGASLAELFNMSKYTGIPVNQPVFYSALHEVLRERADSGPQTLPIPIADSFRPELFRPQKSSRFDWLRKINFLSRKQKD